MADVDTVRLYIADPIQYGVAQSVGDAESTEFLFPNAPIYPDTDKVYVDGTLTTAYEVDNELGLFTMNSAPDEDIPVKISAQFSLLTDAQIQTILDQYVDSDEPIKLAAADCLDIIASSEAMIQKKIKLLDIETDGAAIAQSLREHAKNLREQVFSQKYTESSFDIAELVFDPFSFGEKIRKDRMREGE